MIKKIILVTASVLLFLCSCSNSGGKIKELTFAAIPSEDMVQTTKYTENFSKYLEKELGIKVKYFIATDYTAVIEAMRTNKCQICIFGPFSYILASEKAGAEALVAIGFKGGGYFSYNSLLLSYPGSGLHNMDDVKRNASRLRLTFTDPASTSGHLVPRSYLTSIGLDPDKSFASVAFASNHGASLLSVYSGNTDVGAANTQSYTRLIARGKVDSSKFIILWKSPPLLWDPFCVKSTLPAELKEKIRGAFINMPVKDSASFNQYIKYTFEGDKMRDSLIFREISDSSFNSLRVIARTIKSLNIK